MARPKQAPPLPTDLTLAAWESDPELMAQCRGLAALPAMSVVLAVLTNERPSAVGKAPSLDYDVGFEDCLALLRALLKGRARTRMEAPAEPTYTSPETLAELGWKKS